MRVGSWHRNGFVYWFVHCAQGRSMEPNITRSLGCRMQLETKRSYENHAESKRRIKRKWEKGGGSEKEENETENIKERGRKWKARLPWC